MHAYRKIPICAGGDGEDGEGEGGGRGFGRKSFGGDREESGQQEGMIDLSREGSE